MDYAWHVLCTWELFDEKSSFDDRLVLSSCSSSDPKILGVVISSPEKKSDERFLGMCNFENNVIGNSANILFGTIQIKMFDLILRSEIRFVCI